MLTVRKIGPHVFMDLIQSPILKVCCAVWFSQSQFASQICCGIFLAASFTDFLDGYLARKMVRPDCGSTPCRVGNCKQALALKLPEHTSKHAPVHPKGLTSNFGAFLDPVADKLMVAAVLILLSSRPLTTGPLTGNTWVLPVISSGAQITALHKTYAMLIRR